MASKRIANSPKRAAKRSRTNKLVPVVVDALADAEVLPGDLRTLLKLSLPVAFNSNKVDRHPYEAEVVNQAQQALSAVEAAIKQAHKVALTKQNEVIAPAEMARRTKAKQDAEAASEAAKAHQEACKEANKAAAKAVNDAHSDLKSAEKEAHAVEKELQGYADKKAALASTLATEFAMMREQNAAGAAFKKAVDKLLKVGKECGADSALLYSLPMTCKKAKESRTDFEQLMFTSLQSAIDRSIDALTHKIAETESVKAQKLTDVANGKAALEQAEAASAAAHDAAAAAAQAQKDAAKVVVKADESVYNIWEDMREVCDAQDTLANDVNNFKDNIWTAFQQLKEKEPEPEPVEEPVVEEAAAPDAAMEAAPEVAAA